ncbi:MAG TPA: hypothetical protein PLE45_09990 [Spirochaetota bacterium]|nr:hypothetical protein [Spirochaetota bacterium]HOL57417.1 hypothetical protein [Spirochaetota bacterium]HPP05024.1 hypothetical protein [Spirochaetota bacterium]
MSISTINAYNQVAQMTQMMNRLIIQATIFKSQLNTKDFLPSDPSFTGIGTKIDTFA